jgi:hypothetical protein
MKNHIYESKVGTREGFTILSRFRGMGMGYGLVNRFIDHLHTQLPITVADGLRHELFSLARTLGSWVRIPLKAWKIVCVYSVSVFSCVGSGLATG